MLCPTFVIRESRIANELADLDGRRIPWGRATNPGYFRADVLAQEIADDLSAALEQIQDILGDLQRRVSR